MIATEHNEVVKLLSMANNIQVRTNDKVERKLQVLSKSDIEGLIAEGQHIFILDGKVIKADAWLPFHPGGSMSIQHMVGRDATDEVHAYGVLLAFTQRN